MAIDFVPLFYTNTTQKGVSGRISNYFGKGFKVVSIVCCHW